MSNPALKLSRLGDLAATAWTRIYRRGVEQCQNDLSEVLPSDRLSGVSTTELGLQMLLAGRVDFYCELDGAVTHKKHAELAIRLAAVLKQMKADGSLERFRREVKDELTRP